MNKGNVRQWPEVQNKVESFRIARLGYGPVKTFLFSWRSRSCNFPPGIYIFAYHGIIDRDKATDWETAYTKGSVYKDYFEEQIAFLDQHMSSLKLSDAPELINEGNLDRPYFCITFDDAYQNVYSNTMEILTRRNIKPTVFVNAEFCMGKPYYRILAAYLVKHDHAFCLRNKLKQFIPDVNWNESPQELFDQTKSEYVPGDVEKAVLSAFHQSAGNPEELNIHMNHETVKEISSMGWEIGNHTFDHKTLSKISRDEIYESIEKNKEFWEGQGVKIINWLAYPNGKAIDVNESVYHFLRGKNNMNGIFCNGGVNFVPTRTQWLRMSLGNYNHDEVRKAIHAEVEDTILTLDSLTKTSKA